MKQAFTDTRVVQLIAKIAVPFLVMLTYACSFATSYWVQVSRGSRHWGLWTVCHTGHHRNDTNASEVCTYLHAGDSDAYFEAARVLAPVPLLCYSLLLLQMSLMDLKVCKGHLGALVAYTGALFNVAVVVTVGAGYRSDSRWTNDAPTLAWSFYCSLPPALVALLDGLAMSYAAHRRRYPQGKRSPRRREESAKKSPRRGRGGGGATVNPRSCDNNIPSGRRETMNTVRAGDVVVTARVDNILRRREEMNSYHADDVVTAKNDNTSVKRTEMNSFRDDDVVVTPRNDTVSSRRDETGLVRDGDVVVTPRNDNLPWKREEMNSIRRGDVVVTPRDVNISGRSEKVNRHEEDAGCATPRDAVNVPAKKSDKMNSARASTSSTSFASRDVNISRRNNGKTNPPRGGAVITPRDVDYSIPERRRRENSDPSLAGFAPTPADVVSIAGTSKTTSTVACADISRAADVPRKGWSTVGTGDLAREKSAEECRYGPGNIKTQTQEKLQQLRFHHRLHQLFHQQELQRQADGSGDEHPLAVS